MNESNTELSRNELLNIARALRYSWIALVLGISYLNVRLSFSISWFQSIYHDMLGNKPLPPETAFVIQARYFLIVLSFALPLLAMYSLLLRRTSISINIIGIVVLFVVVQVVFTWHAVAIPFFMIIAAMASGQ